MENEGGSATVIPNCKGIMGVKVLWDGLKVISLIPMIILAMAIQLIGVKDVGINPK
jgi:hypothetical protein